MKNKKGFTLIELLAVIVILAIIALIATPIILNMISKARKSAAKDSALGYIDAINYNNDMSSMNSDYETGHTKINDGTYDVDDIDIKLKGKKPVSGTVTILNGRVSSLDICISGYNVTSLNGKDAEAGDRCSDSKTYTAYSIGDSINFNPETNKKCTSPTSTTGTKQGCMKWYVIKASGTSDSTVDVILDHNTTAKVAWATKADYIESGGTEADWNASKFNTQGPVTVTKQLNTDTAGWANVLIPRLIEADEVAHIVGADSNDTLKWSQNKPSGTNDPSSKSSWFYLDGSGITYSSSDGWQKQVATSQGASNYAWLFNYTRECTSYGCDVEDSSTYGYWTKNVNFGTSHVVWRVYKNGALSGCQANQIDNGVRPVITISKSNLK